MSEGMRLIITGMRLNHLPTAPGKNTLLALVTIQAGMLRINDARLFRDPGGTFYIRGPAQRLGGDAVHLGTSPERSALLAQAIAMYSALAAAQQAAQQPETPTA